MRTHVQSPTSFSKFLAFVGFALALVSGVGYQVFSEDAHNKLFQVRLQILERECYKELIDLRWQIAEDERESLNSALSLIEANIASLPRRKKLYSKEQCALLGRQLNERKAKLLKLISTDKSRPILDPETSTLQSDLKIEKLRSNEIARLSAMLNRLTLGCATLGPAGLALALIGLISWRRIDKLQSDG